MINKTEDFILLKKIQKSIEPNIKLVEDLGIASGLSGVILYQFLLSKVLNSNDEFNKGKRLIELGIEKINTGYKIPTYCNGIVGFFWTLQYLDENNIVEIETDIFIQIDEFIFEAMVMSIKLRNYDFLHGAIGYGVYFLKRYKKSNDKLLKEKYKGYIKRLILYLDQTKIDDINGIKWESPQKSDIDGVINIDLGLAHGVPSIMYFLSLVYESKLFCAKIKPMLINASSFLLSTKHINKGLISLFSTYQYHLYKKEEVASRLGWCYGDVGIGLAFLKVANVLNDDKLKGEALDILKHSALRRKLKENFIYDAGICHGAYGLSQIFGRLYKNTQVNEFYDSSQYWKKTGHAMVDYNQKGDIYYPIYKGDRDWVKPFSLLEGLSGIGLNLISHLTNFEDTWDECLFIS